MAHRKSIFIKKRDAEDVVPYKIGVHHLTDSEALLMSLWDTSSTTVVVPRPHRGRLLLADGNISL